MPRSKSELKRMLLFVLYTGRYDRNIQGIVNQWFGEHYKIAVSPEEKQLLWEAVQEMTTAGLIVRDFTQSGDDFKVLTTKGRKLAEKNGDPEIYSLRLEDVVKDQELLERTGDIFDLERYEESVFAAFKLVEEKVRAKASLGPLDIGTDLMSKALNPNTGKLLMPKAVLPAEQEAVHALFRGAIGLFKNPSSHRTVNYDDRLTAIKTIALAELLLKMLQDAQLKT